MDQSKSVAGAAAMLLACVFVVSSALAGEPYGEVRTEDIKVDDLNLATAAGVDTLYQRIHLAAARVCAVSEQPDVGAASAPAQCSKDALARAIEKMNLPALTALAATHS